MNKPEYTPYGPEWHAEVMKMRKADIIHILLRPALIELQDASLPLEPVAKSPPLPVSTS